MATEYLDIGGIRDRHQQCTLDLWWKDQRFDYNVGNELIYKGAHAQHDAAITDTKWVVWKFTYVTGNVTRIEGPIIGSWDGRAALAWGA